MVEVTFSHVDITISNVKNATEAYDKLCEALASLEKQGYGIEWNTSTYRYGLESEHDVKELWPDESVMSSILPVADDDAAEEWAIDAAMAEREEDK